MKTPPLHLGSNRNKVHTTAQRQQKASVIVPGENLARLRHPSLPALPPFLPVLSE